MRKAEIQRDTKETQVFVALDLDGTGKSELASGIPFLDHMLDQVARHGAIDLTVRAKGDLEIDAHHTVEDIGITLGQALAKALGDKSGIRRSRAGRASNTTWRSRARGWASSTSTSPTNSSRAW
jgi:imidazoleglycerol-phosphate dehydratase